MRPLDTESARLMDISGGPAEDALSRLLHDLRITGVSYGYGRLSAPWGIAFPDEDAARLHCVIEGEAWLSVEGEPPRRLEAGDVAFLARGRAHILRSTQGGPTTCVHDLETEIIGDRVYSLEPCLRPDAVIASCSVTFHEPCLHPLLDLMPIALTTTGAQTDPTLKILLEAMSDEIVAPKIGGATVLARLADVVVTRIVRTWVNSEEARTQGWLSVLRDPQIGRALSAMHRAPGQDWSLVELAAIAGLSRSVFAERFATTMGQPPARYLVRLRMLLASRLLKEQRLGIAVVARQLGYLSVPAFSRAIKRHLGQSPGDLRRGSGSKSGEALAQGPCIFSTPSPTAVKGTSPKRSHAGAA